MSAGDPDFARKMVERLETVLLESAGLQTVTISGQVVSFAQAQQQYEYWKRQLLRDQGKRPCIVSIELEGGT